MKRLLENALKVNKLDANKLERMKRNYSSDTGKPCPTNISLLKEYRKLIKLRKLKTDSKLFDLLKTRNIRTQSGVAVIAVMTKPYKCPGKCIYCPDEKMMPKSYLSNEPAVMRAILNKFDPFKQVSARLKALEITGHETGKVELIIMGGTFSYLPARYQTWYVKRCLDALNSRTSKNLKSAQKLNKKAKHRCVGMTLETRPDYIDEKEIVRFRQLGATRIELGVQTIFDDVLKKVKRGHNVQQTIDATKLLKDAGFKINYHLMPGLPYSSIKKDRKIFSELFKNPDFQPDMIKIYPCIVTKNSKIYRLFKQKKFKPLEDKRLFDFLLKVKQDFPYHIRVTRLIRDIPATSIEGGNKISNLRQDLARELKKRGKKCKCIRCRQATHHIVQTKPKLFVKKYKASDGTEYFLSYEDKKRKTLYAFLRLRITKNQFLDELKEAALIRELHTYGKLIPIKKHSITAVQHLGLGKKLMHEAEKIAEKEGFKKTAVISGIGVREYYLKLGYKLKGTYMSKKL